MSSRETDIKVPQWRSAVAARGDILNNNFQLRGGNARLDWAWISRLRLCSLGPRAASSPNSEPLRFSAPTNSTRCAPLLSLRIRQISDSAVRIPAYNVRGLP